MLPIVKLPNENLRKPSRNLTSEEIASDDIQNLITDMIPTMYDDDGIGLAAPQIGKNIRICIVGKEALPKKLSMLKGTIELKHDLVLINVHWKHMSKKTETDVEGCLSVPNIFGSVKRFKDIQVEALDRNGNPLIFDAHAFFSRVIQHETDHLDGVLFIDKATNTYEVPPKKVKI